MLTEDLPVRVVVVRIEMGVRALLLDEVTSILGPSLTAAELRNGRTNRVTDLRADDESPGWGIHLVNGQWREVLLVDEVIGTGTWHAGALVSLDAPATFEQNSLACSCSLTRPTALSRSVSHGLHSVAA